MAALLPSVVFIGLVFGRHFHFERLREQANADPVTSLTSRVPSERFDIPYGWGEARSRSATWSAALAQCASARPEQINCRRVAIARTVLEVELAAAPAAAPSTGEPEIDPAATASPSRPVPEGDRS
jgi:hypothetical protein